MALPGYPICSRELNEPLAILSDSNQVKTVQCFVDDVYALAEKLPQGTNAINFCSNRYRFMVSFFALCLRDGTNYLPPNRSPDLHPGLAEGSLGLYLIRDCTSAESALPTIDFPTTFSGMGSTSKLLELQDQHLCALSFTSGSTGNSKAVRKPWQTLREGAQINSAQLMGKKRLCHQMIATVPPQHLWGLETSILLPLLAPVCVSDAMPFFPSDVKTALEKLEAPRILVTTPTHLNAIVKSGLRFPEVAKIFCATSPLSKALADATEELFSGELLEIYGCTEMGSLASRRTAHTDIWSGFRQFSFVQKGERSFVRSNHVLEEVELQDSLSFIDSHSFKLNGRTGDLINVAGKRGSIAQISQIIQQVVGIEDCAVFMPKTDSSRSGRPAAIVVSSEQESSKHRIRSALQEELDPVFIPRPILFAPSLPRNETGKLTRSALENLYRELLAD